MNRDQLLLVGLGGAGNRLVDNILDTDDRFQGYFINTSITDLESLENYDTVIQNFLCISQQNGVGRNKNIGKGYAQKYSTTIFDRLIKYQQDTIYLVSSLGGGSGSSILTTTLEMIENYKEMDMFDKTVNLICIIPDIKSQDIIIENALETWRDMFNFSSVINSIIFIDNSSVPAALANASVQDRENYINQEFTALFDSIFDIPESNGTNFDNGNLANVLKDKGCLYIYDLKENRGSIEVALRKAEQESVLAKMYNNSVNTIEIDGRNRIKCGYVGVSLNDPNYNAEEILNNYYVTKEPYVGYNEEKNLLLISGCLPPNSTMEALQLELEERRKNRNVGDFDIFAKSFNVPTPKVEPVVVQNNPLNSSQLAPNNVANTNAQVSPKKVKKVLKKNLFKQNLK